MDKTITIGTRGSTLALIQANMVKGVLEATENNLRIEIKIIKTEGDTNNSPIPLDVVGKGWFTKEIEEALLNHSIDIAVHSLKDMSESLPTGLCIGGYLEREDPRDVLVSKKDLTLALLPKDAVVGTDSLRRKAQLLALRNDLTVVSIRGNVPTRVQKLETEQYDAVVLAAAGLKRLYMEDKITQYFSVGEMLPAPGQGVMVAEVRESDTELIAHLHTISHGMSAMESQAERAFAKSIGGGCKSPVGAYARIEKGELFLEGMLVEEDGSNLQRDTISGNPDNATTLGSELAARMLKDRSSNHA